MNCKLIDIGVNLTDMVYQGVYNNSQKHQNDLADVVDRALSNGVAKMIITGTTLEDSKTALQLAKTNVSLFSTVGCHPTRCLEFDDSEYSSPESYISQMIELANSNKQKIVAIGEFGLDYDRLHFCPKDIQLKYFEKQFEVAESTKLPLFLHSRNSASDLIEVITRNRDRFKHGVVHSFDGTLEEALRLIDLEFYIGINGCSLKTAENIEVVSKLPAERILIETGNDDEFGSLLWSNSPWCEIKSTHAGWKNVRTKFESRKKEKYAEGCLVKGRNEPCNLIQVIEIIAGVRGDYLDELTECIYTNTQNLFFPTLTE